MRAFLLILGGLWLAVAIFLSRTGFSIFWPKGVFDPAKAAVIFFRIVVPVLFFGWIAPTALGLWLLWTKK